MLALFLQVMQLIVLPIPSEASALDAALADARDVRPGAIVLSAAPVALAFAWPAVCCFFPGLMSGTPRALRLRVPSPRTRACGLLLLGGATALSLTTVHTLRGCVAARQLCTGGAFRWSRNPISLSTLLLACALVMLVPALPNALGTGWLALHLDAAARHYEEVALDARFGAEWRSYASSVGRWWTLSCSGFAAALNELCS